MDGVVVKRFLVDGGDGDKCYLSLLSPRDFSPIKCENRMDGVVVKRFLVDGGDGDKCYLSLLSPRDFSPINLCENITLPPHMEDIYLECNSCGPLLYFDDFEGNIVICNLTTKQLKLLPPPNSMLETPLRRGDSFEGSGLGYDPKSGDYKVVINYNEKTELYSFKSGVWRTIRSPDVCIEYRTGVYVNGRCYWVAGVGTGLKYDIISFNFTTESFDGFRRPPKSREDSDLAFRFVEYNGSLGAIGYDKKSSGDSSKGFELWVREESSWAKVFDVVLSGVKRPLGLKDSRWLFLEGISCREEKSGDIFSQLLVYDCITKELKGLGIYDYTGQMNVAFYVESQFALPDAIPMQRSYTEEEERIAKSVKSKRFRVVDGSGSESEDGDACFESKSKSKSEDEDEDDDMEEEG
ncbi:hypothetical protein OROGR_014542 [Orobanche gracilis]